MFGWLGHRALGVFFVMWAVGWDGREVTPSFPPHASATVLCPRPDRNVMPCNSAWRLPGAIVSAALVCSSDLWIVSHRCGCSVKYRVTCSTRVTDKNRTFIVCPKYYCMVPTMPSGDPPEATGQHTLRPEHLWGPSVVGSRSVHLEPWFC